MSEANQPQIMESALCALIKLTRAVQYYPPTHPALETATTECLGKFLPLFTAGNPSTCTVRKEGFFLGDTPVGRQNPLLGKLAPALFARRIQTLLLLPDLGAEDLRSFAQCLAIGPKELVALGGIQKVTAEARIATIWVNEIDLNVIRARKAAIEEEKTAPAQLQDTGEGSGVHSSKPAEAATRAAERNLLQLLEALRREPRDQRYRELLKELPPLILTNLQEGSGAPVLRALSLLAKNANDSLLSAPRREASQEALAQLASIPLLDYLLTMLRGRSPSSPGDAAREDKARIQKILTTLPGEVVVTRVMDHLSEERVGPARKQLIQALLYQGRGAIPILQGYLADERWYVVRNAVAVLGELHDQEAIPGLLPGLDHPDLRVRRETVRSLAKIGGPAAVEILLQIVVEGEPLLQRQALLSLGAIKDPAAVPTLLKLAAEADPLSKRTEVRKETIKALGKIGSELAVPLLSRILGQRKLWRRALHDELRAAAAWALGEIGAPAATEPLQAAAEENSTVVARAALQALKLIQREHRDEL